MGMAVAAIGVVIALGCAIGIARPSSLSKTIQSIMSSPRKIYGLAVARLAIGVVLMFGASSTAFPELVLFFGAVSILKGVMIPLLGLDQVRSLWAWWQARSPLLMRMAYLVGAALGAFLVWGGHRSVRSVGTRAS